MAKKHVIHIHYMFFLNIHTYAYSGEGNTVGSLRNENAKKYMYEKYKLKILSVHTKVLKKNL